MSNPFSKSALENLEISRFIFHVVHDGSEEPVLLEETFIGEHEPFFMELVYDCLKGIRYEFNEGSQTYDIISHIHQDESLFQEMSCQLARNFHASATGAVGPGVFFFFKLISDENIYYAIIKYDHQPVLQYRISDGYSVTIQEIADTITQNRKALQKSALICLTDDGGELMVRDRQASGGDIAHFFKGFLNVRRKQDETQITKALHRAVVDTVGQHVSELPTEFVREASGRFEECVQNGIENRENFFNQYFGSEAPPQVRDTFEQQLHRRGLEDCPFELSPEQNYRSQKRRYRTAGGITFQLPLQSDDWFEITDCGNGETEVTIRTKMLWEN